MDCHGVSQSVSQSGCYMALCASLDVLLALLGAVKGLATDTAAIDLAIG